MPRFASMLELNCSDDLAVWGLACGLEAHVQEEFFRAIFAALPEHSQTADVTATSLFDERLHCEGADTSSLCVSVNIDAPQCCTELFVRGIGVEIAVNERDNVTFLIEDHALPRAVRGSDSGSRCVGHRRNELLLARLQAQPVNGDNGGCRELFDGEVAHSHRVSLYVCSG